MSVFSLLRVFDEIHGYSFVSLSVVAVTTHSASVSSCNSKSHEGTISLLNEREWPESRSGHFTVVDITSNITITLGADWPNPRVGLDLVARSSRTCLYREKNSGPPPRRQSL